jgi:hypothetical protein
MSPSTAPHAIAFAELEVSLARAEICTLAAWARGTRQGRTVLESHAMTYADFVADDALAIAVVFWDAGNPIDPRPQWAMSPEGIDLMCKGVLINFLCWDADDHRPFVTGMRWGPGPLSRLMTTMLEYDSDTMGQCVDEQLRLLHRRRRAIAALGLKEAA